MHKVLHSPGHEQLVTTHSSGYKYNKKICTARHSKQNYPALYTVSTKKQSPTISNITLFRTDEFYKIWKTYSESTQDTTAVAFPIKPVKYPYLRCFILMTSFRIETETVSGMEKAGPFNCCCSHQSVASPSLCSCHGSGWTFLAHFV